LGPVQDNDAFVATPVAPFDGVGDFGAAGTGPDAAAIFIANGTREGAVRRSAVASTVDESTVRAQSVEISGAAIECRTTFSDAAAVCDAAIAT